jgi:hypothetical protein
MVALTGIEGADSQFSSLQLSPSDTKYVQLVCRAGPETHHQAATLSLLNRR